MEKLIAVIFCCLLISTSAKADALDQVYATLEEDYINTLNSREITLKGLKSLENTDADIKISATDNKLYLYYKRRLAKVFSLPKTNADTKAWVSLSREVLAAAAGISPEAELYDFELPDRFTQAVFEDLDGYSHYYGGFDNRSPVQKNIRRNFAARMVDDILLIKILSFKQGVGEEVLQALRQHPDAEGIILDLRGNHGGILSEAVKITDMFLDEGIITYTDGKAGQAPEFYTAAAGDVTDNKPLAVLVDGYTASAAEILAAALSEQNRAVLIGTETYGKGTVQNVVRMDSERAMALTTAYFHTPSGAGIDKAGLKPGICTGSITAADKLADADCVKSDRLNEEADVAVAVKYLKNEL